MSNSNPKSEQARYREQAQDRLRNAQVALCRTLTALESGTATEAAEAVDSATSNLTLAKEAIYDLERTQPRDPSTGEMVG